jgi:hypothetical protein
VGVPTRVVFFSPEQAAALHPDRARALFAAFAAKGMAASVDDRDRDPLAIARALWARPVPFLLADALDQLARFGTPTGRDALVEAARDLSRETGTWNDEGPVDLAARLLADPLARLGLFERAQVRMGRMPPERPTYELRAVTARRIESTAALAGALRAVVGGPWSEAWVHQDDEGAVHAVLLHAAPAEDACEVRPRAPVRGALRVLRADAFRFLVGEARLVVTTVRPMLLQAYAGAWGRALYDDERFFLDAPSLTLKPLQGLGARGLASARLPRGLARAAVIACQLDTGDNDRVEARGPDALARLAPHLRAGGHLTRATIRFYVDAEAQPVDAIVQVPNRLTIGVADVWGGASRGERLARAALAGLGVLSPGAIADDVTTLLPLVHPEWRWREIAGDDGLAAMRERGVLEPVRGEDVRRPATEAMRRVGRSAIAYRVYPAKVGEKDSWSVIANAYYAVAEDWSIPAVSVDVSAMGMLRLRLDAVVAQGGREMGLARGRAPKLPRGVLWVGDLRVESGVVRFFYVVRATLDDADRVAVGKAIARATGFGRAVALVPRGRRLGRDFVEIELDVREQLGVASWRAKLAEAVAELRLEEEVPVDRLVPDGVRLVLDSRRERAVLDGVPLVLGESGYRMLRALAARGEGSEIVPSRELDRVLSGARGSDGATRTAAWKLKSWTEESFEQAGREVPADVRQTGLVVAVGKKGWRLAVRGVVM